MNQSPENKLSIHSPLPPNTAVDEKFSKVQFITIDSDLAGQRIDNFLLNLLKGVPRTHIYKLLRKDEVRVNKKRVKAHYKLCGGDIVRLAPVKVALVAPPKQVSQSLSKVLQASIIFENDGLLVVNKPPGIAVHGGSGVSLGLIEAMRQIRSDCRYLELVHRLDRDTSGCIMIAKKRSHLRHLQEALRNKRTQGGITKIYQALVIGHWSKRAGIVNAPLLKMEHIGGAERIVKVLPDGKPSITRFSILKKFAHFTLIEARPVTGRTHQIRVHAQYKGHALVGDEKYGDDVVNAEMKKKGFKRLFLHAASLRFYLPGEQEATEVNAPLPEDLSKPLEMLEDLS